MEQPQPKRQKLVPIHIVIPQIQTVSTDSKINKSCTHLQDDEYLQDAKEEYDDFYEKILEAWRSKENNSVFDSIHNCNLQSIILQNNEAKQKRFLSKLTKSLVEVSHNHSHFDQLLSTAIDQQKVEQFCLDILSHVMNLETLNELCLQCGSCIPLFSVLSQHIELVKLVGISINGGGKYKLLDLQRVAYQLTGSHSSRFHSDFDFSFDKTKITNSSATLPTSFIPYFGAYELKTAQVDSIVEHYDFLKMIAVLRAITKSYIVEARVPRTDLDNICIWGILQSGTTVWFMNCFAKVIDVTTNDKGENYFGVFYKVICSKGMHIVNDSINLCKLFYKMLKSAEQIKHVLDNFIPSQEKLKNTGLSSKSVRRYKIIEYDHRAVVYKYICNENKHKWLSFTPERLEEFIHHMSDSHNWSYCKTKDYLAPNYDTLLMYLLMKLNSQKVDIYMHETELRTIWRSKDSNIHIVVSLQTPLENDLNEPSFICYTFEQMQKEINLPLPINFCPLPADSRHLQEFSFDRRNELLQEIQQQCRWTNGNLLVFDNCDQCMLKIFISKLQSSWYTILPEFNLYQMFKQELSQEHNVIVKFNNGNYGILQYSERTSKDNSPKTVVQSMESEPSSEQTGEYKPVTADPSNLQNNDESSASTSSSHSSQVSNYKLDIPSELSDLKLQDVEVYRNFPAKVFERGLRLAVQRLRKKRYLDLQVDQEAHFFDTSLAILDYHNIKTFMKISEGRKENENIQVMMQCSENKLRHKNIVRIMSYWIPIVTTYGRLIIATEMEKLTHLDQEYLCEKYSKLNGVELLEWLIKDVLFETLEGLHYLHTNEIIHGDISVGNIMLRQDKAVIIDLNSCISKSQKQNLELWKKRQISGFGTPNFYPENKEPNEFTDCYGALVSICCWIYLTLYKKVEYSYSKISEQIFNSIENWKFSTEEQAKRIRTILSQLQSICNEIVEKKNESFINGNCLTVKRILEQGLFDSKKETAQFSVAVK